jgi:hypothetical protein
MHRRFLFPLAAAVVGLLAISPVFAAEPSPAKSGPGHSKPKTGSGPAKNTTTTAAPDAGDSGSTDSGGTTATTTGGKGGSAPSPPPSSGGGSSGGSAGGSSSSNCGAPQTDQGPAPQVGEPAQNHAAGDAGNVDVERLSPSELRIAKASPNSGWTQQVTAPSGPRVTVRFNHPGGSPSIIRFAASMDQAGRVIHVRVTSCG